MLSASFGLCACAAGTSAALNEALTPARSLGTSVTCSSPCTVEWQRAQFWIAQHSVAKIRTATDVRIETEPATTITGFDAEYSFLSLREPVVDGYRITLMPRCVGGMRGCSPKQPDVVSAFLYYVKTGTDILVGHDTGTLSGLK